MSKDRATESLKMQKFCSIFGPRARSGKAPWSAGACSPSRRPNIFRAQSRGDHIHSNPARLRIFIAHSSGRVIPSLASACPEPAEGNRALKITGPPTTNRLCCSSRLPTYHRQLKMWPWPLWTRSKRCVASPFSRSCLPRSCEPWPAIVWSGACAGTKCCLPRATLARDCLWCRRAL